MDCRELFARLSEYVDDELSEELCTEIQRHLADCAPCVNFAHTLRTTAELCRRLPSRPIPPEVAAELHAILSREYPCGGPADAES